MTKQFRLYRRLFLFFIPLMRVVAWPKLIGKENIPDGACIVVANHTSSVDWAFMMYAMSRRNHTRVLAKKSVLAVPVVGRILRAIGIISVDRSIADMEPIRESLEHLKNGGKIGIFPEGTRVKDGGDAEVTEAKKGAVRIAERTGAPILPMYIPRKKRWILPNRIVIGQPYHVRGETRRMPPEEYAKRAEEMMIKIYEMAEGR